MVVMQLFAADEDSPGHDIGGSIVAFEIAVAQIVTNTVNNACGKEWNPDHLHGENGNTDQTK